MILDNFPRVLWINLDKSTRRKLYMEKLLNSHNIIHTRIKAIDGTNIYDQHLHTLCYINSRLTLAENACTCSHLIALKYFVENMEDDNIIIFEDDVSFEFLEYIPFNWSIFMKNLPEKFDIIQLAITYENGYINNLLIKSDPAMKYYCSAAYLITKEAAKKILSKYYSNKFKKIILHSQEYATADSMISSTGATYSIPIFTYQTLESIIHPRHLINHNRTKTQQLNIWKKTMENKEFDIIKYFNNFEKN